MPQADVKIALLIDADNSSAAKIDVILSELAKYGVVYIRRAYGNWKSPTLKSWEDVLHEYAIQPIQQFDYSKGKNATDIALVIDAMDLLYTQKLDAFGIVSSDSDFTPLIMRIHTHGIKVYGFGEKKTPEPFVNACSKFTYLEALGIIDEKTEQKTIPSAPIKTSTTAAISPETSQIQTNPKPPLSIKSDTTLMNLLRSAVDATVAENGWSSMSGVGAHISNQASFDCLNYGFKKLSDLFMACDLFEVSNNQKGIMVVRQRQKKQVLSPIVSLPKLVAKIESPPANRQAVVSSLEEKYIEILIKKGWERLSKFSLMNFYRVMKNVIFDKKETLFSHALKNRPASKEADAKIAYDIFWKAQLFKIESDLPENKSLLLVEYPDFLDRIDKAMLSRLIRGCLEQKIEIDSAMIAKLLYQDYEQIQLSMMIEKLQKDNPIAALFVSDKKPIGF
ncbi:MAG: NYN domain-containing protein [Candidatus Methylumidiphilus sp.]